MTGNYVCVKTSGHMVFVDLKQHAPRSPRIRLGGFVILPRMLDKCRATLANTNGEYHYDCPLDQRFFSYMGIDPKSLKEEVKKGLGDGEVLEWIHAHAQNPRSELEIRQWSCFQEHRTPSSVEDREFFTQIHKSVAPHRSDIVTWFDLLDLDDFANHGGKP